MLQQILSAFDDLVLLIDNNGRFFGHYNADARLKLAPSEFLNKSYAEVLPPEIAEKLDSAIARLSAGMSNKEVFEYQWNTGSQPAWYACTLSRLAPVGGESISGYAGVIRDITPLVVQRNSIDRKEQALMASAKANEVLLKNRNIVQAASIGLRELGLAMKVDRCYMFRNTWKEELQENVSNQLLEWTSDFIEPHINNPELQDVPFSMVHPFMDCLLQNMPYFCIVSRLPPCGLRDILSMQEIKSLIALPLWVDGSLWGFVGFDDCTNEREWSNADVSILMSFATSVSTAIMRKRTEDDLERAKTEAEKNSEYKSMFLSNITHEIRTPLHGVIGYAEMLSSFRFPMPEEEYFNNLKISANNLYELINNILDFSKIEAGVFEMNPENFILSDIIRSAIASVSYLVKSSNNTLVTDIDYERLPDVIHVDATRLRQILVNLLSNALKFSSDSSVHLDVAMLDEGLRFSIRDHGIGISQEQLTRLFMPFTQFDSSFTKKYQGSGLGLSITRHILSLMGSTPVVESVPGVGSTFAFTLPIETIREKAVAQAVPAMALADITTMEMKVLLVEDNRINMLLVETVLRDVAPGISISKATNGLEAIRLIESGYAPDIILMDLQMPVMDGFETTRIIRELYHAPLHIVALTASAISDVRDRCLASGMDEFITKPFTREQIVNLLQRHVAGR